MKLVDGVASLMASGEPAGSLSRRRLVAGLLVAGLVALGIASPAAASDRVELRGSVPGYADPEARTAQVPATQRLSFHVVLGLRDRAGARALARRLSDPGKNSYRDFVSASEFRRRFSWRSGQIRAVARWLRSQGMEVGKPTSNGVLLPATATVAEFERSFGIQLDYFEAFGQGLVAPRSPLSVPRSMAGMIDGTIGVPQAPVSPQLVGPAGVAPGTATASATGAPSTDPGPPPLGFDFGVVAQQPPPPYCSRYWGAEPGYGLPSAYGQLPLLSICGYKARQIRSAYGAQGPYRKGIDGSGVDIGIVTGYLSPTLQSDLNIYSDDNGIRRTRLRVRAPSRYTAAPQGTVWDFYNEQTLDVQVAHGVAPGARIHYSGPDGADDQIVADSNMVDRNRVEVISNSWALPEVLLSRPFFRAAEDILVQAAAQGITMLYGSGDTGDNIEEVGIRTVSYPASSRWATAVGGTTLAVGPTNQRVWEQAWGESQALLDTDGTAWAPVPPGRYIGGSTGGTSRVFGQPRYQRDRVPTAYSSYFGGRARVVPDVALIADLMTGPGLVQTAKDRAGNPVVTRHSVGGTSVATPVLAGAVAVIADRNGGRLGLLNPSLYRMGKNAVRPVGPPGTAAVSAMVSYADFANAGNGFNVALLSGGEYGTLTVRRGYDDVTGLGSPSVPAIAKHLRRMSR
jgi:subtilase family serine protease